MGGGKLSNTRIPVWASLGLSDLAYPILAYRVAPAHFTALPYQIPAYWHNWLRLKTTKQQTNQQKPKRKDKEVLRAAACRSPTSSRRGLLLSARHVVVVLRKGPN